MQTISIISLKGGVAKTTTAVNIAYILSVIHNYKVLLIDNDKQGNASKAFNLYNTEDEDTIAKVMTEKNTSLLDLAKPTRYKNLHVITANMNLLEANLRTIVDTGRQQQTRFKKAANEYEEGVEGRNERFKASEYYDFCIIDNAPDVNMSIINALVMTDKVIVPILVDQYSFDGLDILLEQINQVKEDFNSNLELAGCLITQYQNNEVNNQGIELLSKRNVPIFNQRIRRTEKKVSESTFAKMPVVEYSVRCGAAQDYKKFVNEFMENVPNLGTR